MYTFNVRQGTAIAFELSLNDPENPNLPVVGYTGEEELSGKVWGGDDTPVLGTFPVTWVDGDSFDTVSVLIPSDLTASLESAQYYVTIEVASGDNVFEIAKALMVVEYSPGSQADLPVYASYQDMIRRCSQLPEAFQAGMQAGFREERSRAREYIDSWILALYRQHQYCDDSTWLADHLAADHLIVDRDSQIVEAASLLALSYVFDSAYDMSSDGKQEFMASAARWRRQAVNILKGVVFGVDTNGDGKADYWLRSGVWRMRGR